MNLLEPRLCAPRTPLLVATKYPQVLLEVG